MKRKYKRFLSLVLSLIMAFSFSVATYAAEEGKSNTTSKMATSSVDSGVFENLTNGYYSGAMARTWEIPITSFQDNRYFYLGIGTKGPIKMTMYQNGVQVSSAVYANQPYDGKTQWLPIYHNRTTNNIWAAGDYTVKVEILFNYEYAFGVFSSEIPIN